MGRWGKDDIPLRTHAGKWTTTFKASQVKYSISQEEFESYVWLTVFKVVKTFNELK